MQYLTKRLNFKLKANPEQLLGHHPLSIALPDLMEQQVFLHFDGL
jgi:hypothetical protein